MLDCAFDECPLNLQHYADFKKDCRKADTDIQEDDLEEEMREMHDDTLPEEISKKDAKTEKGTALTTGDAECKHCGKRGHQTAKDPKCPKHDPSRHKNKGGNKSAANPSNPRPSVNKSEWLKIHSDNPDDFPYMNTGSNVCWGCKAPDTPSILQMQNS